MREYLVVWRSERRWGNAYVTLESHERMTKEALEEIKSKIEMEQGLCNVLITSFQLLEEPY